MIAKWANYCKSIKFIKMKYSKKPAKHCNYLLLNYLFAVIYTETLSFCEHNFGIWSIFVNFGIIFGIIRQNWGAVLAA